MRLIKKKIEKKNVLKQRLKKLTGFISGSVDCNYFITAVFGRNGTCFTQSQLTLGLYEVFGVHVTVETGLLRVDVFHATTHHTLFYTVKVVVSDDQVSRQKHHVDCGPGLHTATYN